MTTQHPHDDRELSELLKSWTVETHDDPALTRKVWRRIEAQPSSAVRAWLDSLARLFTQPVSVAAALALFAALGALTAELQSSARREARLDRLATEYARSIDPVLMSADLDPDAMHRP